MKMNDETRAWLERSVERILTSNGVPADAAGDAKDEMQSHVYSMAEDVARSEDRAEVTVPDLEAALREAGDDLVTGFVAPLHKQPAPARLTARFAAYLADTVLLFGGILTAWAVAYVITAPLYGRNGIDLSYWRPDFFPLIDPDYITLYDFTHIQFLEGFISVLMFVFVFGVQLAYYAWFEARHGGTPGKRLLGLRVVRHDGLPLTARDALLRNATKVGPLAELPLIVPDALFLLAKPHQQRASDRWRRTRVVHDESASDEAERPRAAEAGASA